MHFLLALILTLACFNIEASEDKAVKELFDKYEKIMQEHKIELIDEVFTKKFLKENGGKEEFIEKIKELPKIKKKSKLKKMLERWKKSKMGNMIFAKVKKQSGSTEKTVPSSSSFVIVEEEGQLKIDGTISDDE